MRSIDQIEMHKDHVNWSSEVAMWEQDILMWNQEMEALRKALRSIKVACEEHQKGIDAHLRSVKKHRHSFQLDESFLAMVEPGGYPDSDIAALHSQKSMAHQIQRDAHTRLKQYHHLIMILTKQIKGVLEGPM